MGRSASSSELRGCSFEETRRVEMCFFEGNEDEARLWVLSKCLGYTRARRACWGA